MSRKLTRPITTFPNKSKSSFLFTASKKPHQTSSQSKIPYADIQKISLMSREDLQVNQEREIEREREIKRIQLVLVKWGRDVSEKAKKSLYGNLSTSPQELNANQSAIKSVIQALHQFQFSIACYIIQTVQKPPAYKHPILLFCEQLAVAINCLCKAHPSSHQNTSLSFQFVQYLWLQLLDLKKVVLRQNNSATTKMLLFSLMRIFNLLFSVFDLEKEEELTERETGVVGDLIDIGDWAWQYFHDGGMRRRGEEGGEIAQDFILCLLGFHIQDIKTRPIELTDENTYTQHLQRLVAAYMEYTHTLLSSSLLLLIQRISPVQILMQNLMQNIWMHIERGIGREEKEFQVLSTIIFEYGLRCGELSMPQRIGKWAQLYMDTLAQKVIVGDPNIGRQPWMAGITAIHSSKILKYLFTQPTSCTLDTTPILLHLNHIIPILSNFDNTHTFISHLASFITSLTQLLKAPSSLLTTDTNTQTDEYIENISSIFLYLDREINIKVYFGHVEGSNQMIRVGRKMFGSRLFLQLSQDLEGVCKDDVLDGMYLRTVSIVVQDICESSDNGLWFIGMVTLMMQLSIKCAKHFTKNDQLTPLHKLGVSLEYSLNKIKSRLQVKFSSPNVQSSQLAILENFSEIPSQTQNSCYLLLEYCSEGEINNLKILEEVNDMLAIFIESGVAKGSFCDTYQLVRALSLGRSEFMSRMSQNGDAADVLRTFLIHISKNYENFGEELHLDNTNPKYEILLKITVHLKNFSFPESMEVSHQKANSIFEISKLLCDYFILVGGSRNQKDYRGVQKDKRQVWRVHVEDCLGDLIDGTVICLRLWVCQRLIELIHFCEDGEEMENLVVALYQSTTLSTTFLNKKPSKTSLQSQQVCCFLSKHLKYPTFHLFSQFLESHPFFNDPQNPNLILSCLGNQPIGCQQEQYQNIQFIPFSRQIKEKVNTILEEYCKGCGIEVVKLGVAQGIQVALSESKKLRKIYKVKVQKMN